ncbi:MAG: secondary thiamine-phosphate synthase enzyme YjbQ [Clostridiaceae bacterium]
MLCEFTLASERNSWTDVTARVRDALRESGVRSGLCVVYCPHTTAGITINENADPDVVRDLIFALEKTYPDRAEFRHSEGNSASHLKASVIGSSATIIVREGRLLLGTWQGIYFCEFDGPRTRRFYVEIMEANA